MGMVGKVAKVAGIGVVGLALVVGGGLAYAKHWSDANFATHVEVPDHDFPIPFPLSDAEVAELRAQKLAEQAAADPALLAANVLPEGAAVADPLGGVDLAAIAQERAVARGEHLVKSRFVCVECHGHDFGGGTMVDVFPIGTLLGPNLTTGSGSRTVSYTAADWSRAVRHGVAPDRTKLVMPADDFFSMSDHELSDVISYVRAQPPVDREMPRRATGPLAWVLHLKGDIVLAADKHPGHDLPHAVEPPAEGVTVEFGEHMAGICTGCHRADLSGGPIAGGDPSWAPAANLTTDASGLKDWAFEDFDKALRTGVRPDGTPLKDPMVKIVPYAHEMTDTELRALWTYLQQVPPVANEW